MTIFTAKLTRETGYAALGWREAQDAAPAHGLQGDHEHRRGRTGPGAGMILRALLAGPQSDAALDALLAAGYKSDPACLIQHAVYAGFMCYGADCRFRLTAAGRRAAQQV